MAQKIRTALLRGSTSRREALNGLASEWGPIGGWTFPDDGVLSQKQSLFRERGEIHRALIGSQESKALSSGARNEASP